MDARVVLIFISSQPAQRQLRLLQCQPCVPCCKLPGATKPFLSNGLGRHLDYVSRLFYGLLFLIAVYMVDPESSADLLIERSRLSVVTHVAELI